MDPEEAAFIARETVDKAEGERPKTFIQYATVVGLNLTEGVVPYVTVVPDGPGNGPIVATSLIGSFFFEGMRVAIMWAPPAGCVIIGTPNQSLVAAGRVSLLCTVGDHPTVIDGFSGGATPCDPYGPSVPLLGHVPELGGVWGGDAGSGTIYCLLAGGWVMALGGGAYVTQPSPAAGYVLMDSEPLSTGSAWLIVHYVDSSNYVALAYDSSLLFGTTWGYCQVIGGVITDATDLGVITNEGDRARIEFTGLNVKCFINSVSVGSFTIDPMFSGVDTFALHGLGLFTYFEGGTLS